MNWHEMSKEEILDKYKTSVRKGLSDSEAKKRLTKYGFNILPKEKKDSIFVIFFRQLMDPIVLLLLVTVIFSLLIREYIDAIAIAFIILVDLVMGTLQEWKAEKNAEALSSIIKVMVNVIRDGRERLIDSSLLVPGDIVELSSGVKVSSDMRIIEAHNLQINESILTGESTATVKSSDVLKGDHSIGDRYNMAYSGTSVITGRGLAVVVGTGTNTEIGKIADHIISTKEAPSPLTVRMNKFSKQISLMVVIVAIIIAIVLVSKDVPRNEIFLSVIALSVSAMPEGLPLALTMALTIASNRMAKKNVIVKKLSAVESLGSCTVIASDKTGTLTVNEQTAKKIVLPDDTLFNVSGTGYNDAGKVEGKDLGLAEKIAKLAALNNEAHLDKIDGKWISHGDSIDIAFLALAKKMKIDLSNDIIGIIPYESENKYSAVFYRDKNKVYCSVKGSPEVVLKFSETMGIKNEKLNIKKIVKQNEDLAKDGYRVIAIASAEVANFKEKENYSHKDIPKLNFDGLVAFIDPIRKEAKNAISECANAGIKVVMITGDHPLTAYAIAKDLELVKTEDEVATGSDVQKYFDMGEAEFDKFVASKRIFSRVSPTDKLNIVQSYKRQGEFIAVTGDGVNDAPAIRSANIGIAMGSGTDVAKETARMIIVDDNFNSIVAGIKEGRNAYSNIRKVSYMLLSCGMAEVFFFILSLLANMELPLVAIQLLWLNIVTDGLQDFALSFEKAEPDIMKKPPISTKENIFNNELIREVAIAGGVIGIVVFIVWVYLIKNVGMEAYVARGYIMALMVFMQNVHVLNCRSEDRSVFKVPLSTNKLVVVTIISAIALQVIVMEVPFLSQFLKTTSIPFIHLVYLFLISLIILVIMEIYKKLKRT